MSQKEDRILHVHSLSALDVPALEQLVQPSVHISQPDGEALPPPESDVLVGGRPSREQLEACPNVRTLIIPYAGVPESTRTLMQEFPHIAVHNLHHNAAAAAELALALFLAAAKRLIPADRALRQGDWSVRYTDGGDLQLDGKTCVVLGLGAIGTRIARVCSGLGMKAIGIRRSASADANDDGAAEIHTVDELHAQLPRADALFISVPLTPATEGMIGERELDLLPKRSVLINIARGSVVDEEALFRALSIGNLGAAGIDVWYHYPRSEEAKTHTYPSSFPYHELDNVVLSPHRGGAFNRQELERLRIEHLARLLNAAANGGPVPNRVDLDAGY